MHLWRWLAAALCVAMAVDLTFNSGWVLGLVVIAVALGLLPANTALDRLRIASAKWTLFGIATLGVGVHFLVGGNWGAGTTFVLLACFPLGFAVDLHEVMKRSRTTRRQPEVGSR